MCIRCDLISEYINVINQITSTSDVDNNMKEKIDNTIHSTGSNGALTSGYALPIWQVAESLLRSVARRMKKGNDKGYPIHNWRTGLDDVAFLRDRANHAATHLMHLLNGNSEIDDAQGNVDALSWFCNMMNEAIRLHPDVVDKAFYSEARNEKSTQI